MSADRCELLCLDLPRAERLRGERLAETSARAIAERAKGVADPTRLAIAHVLAGTEELLLCSARGERFAGLAVVAAIFTSACVAGSEAVRRMIDPSTPEHLFALAAAGAVGYVGNVIAAHIRTRAGRRPDSPALIADGAHARADAYVSLAVIASPAVIAVGLPIADPLIGLGITLVILRITWQSWRHGSRPRALTGGVVAAGPSVRPFLGAARPLGLSACGEETQRERAQEA